MTGCPFANLIDPDVYADGMPYQELKRIRDDGPLHYMEDPTRGVPYWLITGRDEIDFISKHPQLFSSEARSALADEFTEQELETIHRHMTINMDPPRQLKSRRIVRATFTPAAAGSMASSPRMCRTWIRTPSNSISAVNGIGTAQFARSLLPRTTVRGATRASASSTPRGSPVREPMSPAWTMCAQPSSAATASGRNRP